MKRTQKCLIHYKDLRAHGFHYTRSAQLKASALPQASERHIP
jgi:hypothetical protein